MELLADWLRQIIVVVLLATFIDLMLPNKTMQRYVKLVVSLFLLMTILSPVLQLFGASANLRMLAATVEGWSMAGTSSYGENGANAASSRTMPALSELLSEGEALQRQRDEQSLVLLADRLEVMVVDHVKTQHGVPHAAADAELSLDADGLPVIRSIRVRIGESAETAMAEGDGRAIGSMPSMEPVKIDPVEIDPVRIGGRDQPDAEDSAVPAWQSGESPGPADDAKTIALSVARAWSIPASKVTVEFVE